MEQHYTIGFAGHVDHGKTTLVKALTGIDTDRRPEEKRRGLSIEAGVAPLRLPSGRAVAVVDVPGHVDFLKNTIRGLNGIDLGVLVIAADDGVMPQTLEHLEIMKYFKASSGLVVLSKTDLVDDETVDIAELEVKDLLDGTFLDHRTISRFTAKQPERTAEILARIDVMLSALPVKNARKPFRLWIDQTKRMPGHGTVVSGTVASGVVAAGDEIVLLPAGRKTRVRSLESHGMPISHATAGQRVGINLHGISIIEACRGMSLAPPDALLPTFMLNADVHTVATAKQGINHRQRVKLYLGTSVTTALAIVMTGDRLAPGETGLVQFRLTKPVAALPQDAFVVSPMNLNTVIAGGRVLEAPREKFRVAKAGAIVPLLSALKDSDVDAYVTRSFDADRGRFITAKGLSEKTGLPQLGFERRITAKVQKGELVYFKNRGAISASHLSALGQEIRQIVSDAFQKDPLKRNVTAAEIAERLGRPVSEAVLTVAAESLCKAGKLSRFEGGFLLPDTESMMDAGREALKSLLMGFARESGLAPFSADTFCKLYNGRYDKKDVGQLLNFMSARKLLVRLNDGRFLSPEAIEIIKARVAKTIAARGFITVGDCKELLGYGRWGGTHVLDYLNHIGFTVRREDKHVLKTVPRP